MNRFGAGATGRSEDPLDDEIALCRRAGADQERLVRDPRVERVAVGLGVDRDRADAELAQRAEDPDRDLAAIGHENFREERHGRRILSEP